MEQEPCAFCVGLADIYCGECRSIWYCSAKCRRDDWLNHKLVCKQKVDLEPRPGPDYRLVFYFPAPPHPAFAMPTNSPLDEAYQPKMLPGADKIRLLWLFCPRQMQTGERGRSLPGLMHLIGPGLIAQHMQTPPSIYEPRANLNLETVIADAERAGWTKTFVFCHPTKQGSPTSKALQDWVGAAALTNSVPGPLIISTQGPVVSRSIDGGRERKVHEIEDVKMSDLTKVRRIFATMEMQNRGLLKRIGINEQTGEMVEFAPGQGEDPHRIRATPGRH